MTSTYFWYKEHHICVECHAEKATPHSTRCASCLSNKRERDRERAKKLRQTPEYKNKQKSWYHTRRDRLKELGICTICGKFKARKGKTTCTICATKMSTEQKNRTKSIPFQLRAELGICYRCSKPVVEGYHLCEKHLVLQREHMQKAIVRRKQIAQKKNS